MEEQTLLQRSVEGVIDRFSNESLPIQKQTIQCSLDCFSALQDYKEIGKCMQKCNKPFEELQKVTEKEFSGLQRSVQRCQQGCYDSIQPQIDGMGLGKPDDSKRKALELQVFYLSNSKSKLEQ